MAKRIYLAGKLNSGKLSIRDFSDELEDRGHVVLEKWWQEPKLPTPYLDHAQSSATAAEAMIKAAYRSDVTILFPDSKILGAAVEFGAAIASAETNPDKKIVVVNPFETRQSVFYAHPAVLAVHGIYQIREMSWY